MGRNQTRCGWPLSSEEKGREWRGSTVEQPRNRRGSKIHEQSDARTFVFVGNIAEK
jgi:hypothetical protein